MFLILVEWRGREVEFESSFFLELGAGECLRSITSIQLASLDHEEFR